MSPEVSFIYCVSLTYKKLNSHSPNPGSWPGLGEWENKLRFNTYLKKGCCQDPKIFDKLHNSSYIMYIGFWSTDITSFNQYKYDLQSVLIVLLSLYKFCSCLLVCLYISRFVCLSVCHIFSNPHRVAKWTWIFTKPSPNIKFGLSNSLKLSRFVHMAVCTHTAWKHAPYFCAFFATFFISFLKFWSLSLLKI